MERWEWTADSWHAMRRFADRIGVPLAAREPQPFAWDGRTLATKQPRDMVVHDLAHWIVASPDRRHVHEFGLGAGPETAAYPITHLSGRVDISSAAEAFESVDGDAQFIEEGVTALINLLIELELGIDPGWSADTMSVTWQRYNSRYRLRDWRRVDSAARRGVIDGSMRVQWPQRRSENNLENFTLFTRIIDGHEPPESWPHWRALVCP